MAKAKVEDIRNVAFCGHGGVGKTTLVDQLLIKTGAVPGTPSVDDGTSIGDFAPEEKQHKYTIEATVTHFDHAGKRFNVVDTPGYPDFIGQTIGGLRGVDNAVIVVNSQSGIEVNTRRVFEEAGKAGVGRFVVINKMDGENIDFEGVVGGIQDLWGSQCVLLNVPVGQGADFEKVASTLHPTEEAGALVDPNEIREALIESIIEVDEEVMEKYFEGEVPSDEQLAKLAVRAVAAGSLVPILCCSAKTGVGLDEILHILSSFGLDPTIVPQNGIEGENEVEVKPDPNGPLVAQIFRT
ncbi:MAG TPA: GTP-binding protein, partial [Planctomycetes bacterium]|nr:GTP-binding protein [Planctomycetota bacterium]